MRAVILCGDQHVQCWGLWKSEGLIAIWTSTADEWRAVLEEMGMDACPGGLLSQEKSLMTDADDSSTPPEAWAALARYRLTDQRGPLTTSDFVKE